jgi:Phosphotransferase system, mannose/fructose/N-acetylgalactosamine-specific component IIB
VTDTLKDDPIRVTSVKLAKPESCKLVVKNVSESIEAVKSKVTDKYKLMVVCETVDEGVKFVKALGIGSLNVGNTRPGEGKEKLDSVVFVTPEEKAALSELKNSGVDVYMQMIPDSRRIKF